jgi:hypothetical protein
VTADMDSAVVVKGDKLTLDFEVPKAGSILRFVTFCFYSFDVMKN